jgi:hypothetical protein
MEAPSPKETPNLKKELDYKINVNEKFFQFNLKNLENSIVLSFSNLDDFPPLIYEEEFNLEKLKKNNLLFSLYNSIEDIILYIDANLKEKKYIFEINEKEIVFVINSSVIGIPDIKLLINKKEVNEKLIILTLCEEFKKLKERIKKIENLELNNNYNNNNNNNFNYKENNNSNFKYNNLKILVMIISNPQY